MTKKAQILDLLAKGYSTRKVADLVGCHSGYVRAARQRHAKPCSNAEYQRKYRKLHPERHKAYQARYLAKPGKIEAQREYNKLWMRQNRARKASQEART